MAFVATLLIGVVAGSRSMTAPAAVAWAARLGWIDLVADLGRLHGLALGGARLLGPRRWSSSSPTSCRPPRAARCRCSSARRIVSGAFCGAALGALAGGAVARPGRRRRSAPSSAPSAAPSCAGASRPPSARDRPAALIEDAAAIVLGARRRRRWHDRRALRRHRHRRRPGRAVAGGAPRRRRAAGGARRAAPPRRHLRQHRLPPDQDADRQRQGRGDGAPRRRLRHRRRAGRRRHAGGAWRASTGIVAEGRQGQADWLGGDRRASR